MTKEVIHPTTEQIERILSVLAHRPYANHNERLPGTVLVNLEDLKEILLEHGVIATNPPVSYFSHDGSNFEFHKTREAAIEAAESGIEHFQERLANGDGYDIYSDGEFHDVSYGIVLRSSHIAVDDTVTEKHHERDDYKQWPVGTDILRLGLNGLSEVVNPKLVLNAPARIGGTTFREGIAWETVINAAIRHYRNERNNEKSKPIVSPRQLMQIAMGDLILVPKTPSAACLSNMAMRYRHDFGLLDQDMQESCLITMRQLYEEATGQGFYKPEQEEKKALFEGLGTRHSYLDRFRNMETVAIKLSPEEVEKYKKDLEEIGIKNFGAVDPVIAADYDAIDAFSRTVFQSMNMSKHLQNSDGVEPKISADYGAEDSFSRTVSITASIQFYEKIVFEGVDTKYKYFSIDADGEAYYTEQKPYVSCRGDFWGKDISMKRAPTFGFAGNWKDSLVIRTLENQDEESSVISTLEIKQEVLK